MAGFAVLSCCTTLFRVYLLHFPNAVWHLLAGSPPVTAVFCASNGAVNGFWLLMKRLRHGLAFGPLLLWSEPMGLCGAARGLQTWGLPTEPPHCTLSSDLLRNPQ